MPNVRTLLAVALAWLKSNWSLIFNSTSIIATRLITALSGIAFWALATNTLLTAEIGFIGAALSSMLTVANFSMLGIGTYLVSNIHRTDVDRRSLVTTGLIFGGLAGVFLGSVYALLAPHLVRTLNPLDDRALGIAIFALICGLSTFALLLEEVLVGMLLGGMTVLRSVVFALVRVTTLWFLLYGLGIKDVLVMFAAWIVADLVSCSVLYAYARIKRMRPHPGKFVLPLAQQAIGSALRHHVLNFMLNLSGMFVPIIVAAVLSAEPNAMFSVAWNNTSFAFSIPYALTSVFYAAGQQQPLTIQGKLRQLLLMGAGASALAGVVFWIAAPLLMRSFGASYVSQATFAIRVIVLAVFPVLIKGLWVTLLRIRGHMRLALRATSLGGILELGLPALGGLWYGVPGACIGWLISQVILAAVFAVPVLQATRESP